MKTVLKNSEIGDLRKLGRNELRVAGIGDSDDVRALEVDLLLGHVLGLSREQLIISNIKEISSESASTFSELLERRKKHEPIAYIIGQKEFYSRDFIVSPAVLIPRPETEVLVTKSLELFDDDLRSFTVVDIGTGTGAIILSIICELREKFGEAYLKRGKFIATDISENALEVAKANSKALACEEFVEMFQTDLLDIDEKYFAPTVNSEDFCDLLIIVSNPPYVSLSEELSKEVKDYEPELALFGGNDGLDVIKRLVEVVEPLLKNVKRGEFLFEIGATQSEDCLNILKSHLFHNYQVINDLTSRPRIIRASI